MSDFARLPDEPYADSDRALELGSAIVRAFEYRHFHDVVDQIEAATAEDPEELRVLVEHLWEWKVLESRAILEIIKGRLQIVEKFHDMIVTDAPETAPKTGTENMHDLIAAFPWLIDPDWQVLAEEKTITATMREWGEEELAPEDRSRYDFLALSDEQRLVIVEIKRSGHAVTTDDLQRLLRYKDSLAKAHAVVEMVLISGGDVATDRNDYPTVSMLEWSEIYDRTRRYYRHYLAILEGSL